jgi:hypothetical protein
VSEIDEVVKNALVAQPKKIAPLDTSNLGSGNKSHLNDESSVSH